MNLVECGHDIRHGAADLRLPRCKGVVGTRVQVLLGIDMQGRMAHFERSARPMKVRELLQRPAKESLITDMVEMGVPLARRINRHKPVEDMITPPADGHLPMYFPDGRSWLALVLAYNQLEYPHLFDIERVESEVFRCIHSGMFLAWLSFMPFVNPFFR